MKYRGLGFVLFFSLPVFAQQKECKEDHCVPVSISGCTLEGLNYADEVSCDVVRHQGRPFHAIPAPTEPDPKDPRLQDEAFMKELNWVTTQVRSCGCVCCHDTSKMKDYALWDIKKPYIWTDQLTKRGVVILGGQLSSTVFGNIPPADNNGFDRTQTGAPTTDIERFKAFFQKEVDRRGITAEDIAKMRPLNIPGT